jgi:hypothetical protein
MQKQHSEQTKVTVSSDEYQELKRDQNWLHCLEAAGVDNWDGYTFAREIYRQRGHDD